MNMQLKCAVTYCAEQMVMSNVIYCRGMELNLEAYFITLQRLKTVTLLLNYGERRGEESKIKGKCKVGSSEMYPELSDSQCNKHYAS
jgi:hypothetical protein